MATRRAALAALIAVAASPALAAPEPAEKGTPDRLEFGARVYVRDTLTGVDAAGDTTWLEERTLDTARPFLVYRPNKRLRMDLEVDFAGDQAELKDTFIRYEPFGFLDVTYGRFKRPISFVGLASTWELPRVDRGLLSEVRIEDRRLLFAGGRADGLALGFELPGLIDGLAAPELTLALQESDLADDLGLPLDDAVNQDLFGRLEAEIAPGLRLAIAGGWVGALARRGAPDSFRHRPFATLEAFLEREALRVWAEVAAGLDASSYVGGVQQGRFVAGRALVAPRFHDALALREIEPYVALAGYEPTTLADGDRVAEATAGLTLWVSRRLRLQLEGGRRLAEGAAAIAEATVVRVQLGAAFKSETELP